MPSVKCVHCGYRILVPAPTNICPNCGKIFSPSAQTSDTADIPLTGTVVPPSSSSSSSSSSAPPRDPDDDPWIVDSETEPMFTPMAPTSPRFADIMVRQRRNPDLRGMVIHLNLQQGVPIPRDWFLSILKQIWDVIWPVYEPGRRDERKKNVTIVRIRLQTDEQREARFEGDFTLGGLALGDEVSLWGRSRRGVLWVRRAFNHTSQAEVTTSTRQESMGTSLLIVGVFLLIATWVLILTGWLTLFPTPHFHFHFWPSH